MMSPEERADLIREARAARENAVATFSGFRVGAAIRTKDGTIFRGCNVENCTYGLTLCAERVAIFAAMAAGHREFDAVAVVTQSDKPSTPCGACRQILWEFCGDIPVVLANMDGDIREFRLASLYPAPFDLRPEDL